MLCACHSSKEGDGQSQDMVLKGDSISLDEHSPVLSKIKLGKAVKEPYQVELSTSGVVRAIPSNYAEIASPFSGRIAKTFVKLGQAVSAGSPIFEISSPAFFETTKSYFQAKQELDLALKNLNRERGLVKNKVGVQRELEEVEVNYELKKKEFENAAASLKVYQIDPDDLHLGQPLLVRSPINGKVVSDKIVIGQYLKDDDAPVVVIANLNKVWVVAHVKEKDLHYLNPKDSVEIRLVADPDQPIPGVVYHISEMLDEETRSVEVLIECENKDGKMKPAMYATVRLWDSKVEALRIPASAVLQEEKERYVLISLGNHTFRKQKVEIGASDAEKTVVLSRLEPGDEIITTGAFYLLNAR